MLELVPIHAKTKVREVRISADVYKAFETYRKNLILVDYEKDVWPVSAIIESWICSFKDSEEFKNIQKQADEIRAENKAEIEANKKKKIEKLEAELKKLKGEID